MTSPLLEVNGLTKAFPGIRALDGVSLSVSSGETVAVVGQNGSGKSTLVKILAGVYEAEAGTVTLRSEHPDSVSGYPGGVELHFIHQDLGLISTLDTVENLDIGRSLGPRRSLSPFRRRDEEHRARAQIERFGLSIDVRLPLGRVSPAERTIVAIARALDGWTRPDNVLVLDEPTAALSGEGVDRLFEAMRRVTDEGAGIIYISHRLDEVLELADRVVALRDGVMVANVEAGSFDHADLVRMVAGRDVSQSKIGRSGAPNRTIMTAVGVAGSSVQLIDLDVRGGEIVGIAGLLGSGREHVCGLMFGAIPRTDGEVRVEGALVSSAAPRDAIAAGMGLVPADRRAEGLVMDHPVYENLTLPRLAPLTRTGGRLDRKAEQAETARWIEQTDLRPAAPNRPVKLFSGGNQQKVVLARWLRNEPKILLLDEPTQGVDVGAKATIYELVAAAADAGSAVVVSSSDMKELTMLCDRVLVMRDGVVAAELEATSLSEERLIKESLGPPGEPVAGCAGSTSETHGATPPLRLHRSPTGRHRR